MQNPVYLKCTGFAYLMSGNNECIQDGWNKIEKV